VVSLEDKVEKNDEDQDAVPAPTPTRSGRRVKQTTFLQDYETEWVEAVDGEHDRFVKHQRKCQSPILACHVIM
jgi:hypothetical protein